MTSALLIALALGALAAGVLLGRYYVPDDRALKRSAKLSRSYIKTINLLLERRQDEAVNELIAVVEENVEDVEPYFALGALFRARGEWERAIRVHQAVALREQGNRKQMQRARYQLGLDFRAAGMPRRATQAMEECVEHDSKHLGAMQALCGLYEEQGRFAEAAATWRQIAKLNEDENNAEREHHLLCAAAQKAMEGGDLESAKRFLKDAKKLKEDSAHYWVAMGDYCSSRQQWKKARDSYIQAIECDLSLKGYLMASLHGVVVESLSQSDGGDSEDSLGKRAEREIEALFQGSDAGSIASAERQLGDGSKTGAEEGIGPKEHWEVQLWQARRALLDGDQEELRAQLEALAGADGLLEQNYSQWHCSHCSRSYDFFFWRCEGCRQWGKACRGALAERLPERDRRGVIRGSQLAQGSQLSALPTPSLASGLSAESMESRARRHSAISRAGKWISQAWSRDRKS